MPNTLAEYMTSFRYLASAPTEYKIFLEDKNAFNKHLLDLFFGEPDVCPPWAISVYSTCTD